MRSVRRELPPRGGLKGKQANSYYTEAESQSDNKIVVSSIRKVLPSRTTIGVDLYRTINAKRGLGEGDLLAKLVTRAIATANPTPDEA